MEFVETALENGLEIVAECDCRAHSSAYGFFVRTGSRDESDDVAGVSHFLEHMVFKGTPTRSPDDVNREFDEMGAHYNAFTSEESTVYYAAVLPEFQDQVVGLLGDILRPSLRSEDFDTEKQVIIEEIRMYEDQPPYCADERAKALHFGRHPLGRSVLGTVESITALPVERMRDYFQRRYSPRNITLVAAGRVDFDALVASARRWCGEWPAQPASRDIAPAEACTAFECIRRPTSTQEYVVQLADAPAADDPLRFSAKLLTSVVGDDTGSRLYWELADPGLAEHVSLSHYEYQGAGLFMTYMSCEPTRAEDNLQRISRVYHSVEADGVAERELETAKRKVCARVVLGSERPRGRLFSVGSNWIQRRTYRSVRDDVESVQAVSVDEIRTVLARYPLTRSASVVVGPLEHVQPPT